MKELDYAEQENISSQEKVASCFDCFDKGFNERASEPLKVNQNILNVQGEHPSQNYKSPIGGKKSQKQEYLPCDEFSCSE